MHSYKILIISRSFAPDSIVAAIRPTQMAKYLSLYGHHVTVIRSGRIVGKGNKENMEGLGKVTIFSYDDNSDAEKIEKGITLFEKNQGDKSNNHNVALQRLKKVLHTIYDPIHFYIQDCYVLKNRIMKLYRKNKIIRNYDVVISTFSPLGCILAGRTISKQEKCKWIIDLRDLMDNSQYPPIVRMINRYFQSYYCKLCNVCLCVSEGNSNRLRKQIKKNNVITFYNGYDDEKVNDIQSIISIPHDNKLHICYTGTIHNGKSDCTPLFDVIKQSGLGDKIVIDYAGNNGSDLLSQADSFGIGEIIVDHGYLSRNDTAQLQEESHIFLVLSWNTKLDQGILTGKFYEAIKHHKPVIAIVGGNIPDSELKGLVEKYHLGICYEEARREKSFNDLQKYLINQCSRIEEKQDVFYQPLESAYAEFDYSETMRKLEAIIESIV